MKPISGKIGGFDGDNVIFVDPAGGYILLSSQRSIFEPPAVLKVDLATAKSTAIGRLPARACGTGMRTERRRPRRPRLAGRALAALLSRQADGGLPQDRQGRRATKTRSTDVETLLPVAGSDKGYVIANKATGRYGVYRYDFATDTLGEPVFEHPDVDVEGVGFSARTGDPDAVLYVDDRDRVAWLDPAMKALQARLDKALPGAVNLIVARDADRQPHDGLVGQAAPRSRHLLHFRPRARRSCASSRVLMPISTASRSRRSSRSVTRRATASTSPLI